MKKKKTKIMLTIVSIVACILIIIFYPKGKTGFDYQTVPGKSHEEVRKTLVKYGAENLEAMRSSDNTPLPYETFDMNLFELILFYISEPDYREGLI